MSDAAMQMCKVTNQLSGALADVNLSLLDGEVGEAAAAALDGGERVHDLALTLHVRVHDTQNMLEVVGNDQRHVCRGRVSHEIR